MARCQKVQLVFKEKGIASPGGRFVLVLKENGTDRIRDLTAGEDLGLELYPGRGPQLVGAAFSPDERFLLTWYAYGPARVWDLWERKERTDIVIGVNEVSPKLIEKWRRQWRGDKKRLQRNITHSMGILKGGFSPNGRYLYVVYLNRTVKVFDVATGEEVGKHYWGYKEALFSQDKDNLYLKLIPYYEDKQEEIVEVISGAIPVGVTPEAFDYDWLEVSQEGRHDPDYEDAFNSRHFGLSLKPTYYKVSPDGRRILFADERPYSTGSIPFQVFDVPSKNALSLSLSLPVSGQSAVRLKSFFSQDGHWLLLQHREWNDHFKKWSRRDSLLMDLNNPNSPSLTLERKTWLAPDNRHVLSLVNKEKLEDSNQLVFKLLDLQSGLSHNLPARKDLLWARFSEDGKKILTHYPAELKRGYKTVFEANELELIDIDEVKRIGRGQQITESLKREEEPQKGKGPLGKGQVSEGPIEEVSIEGGKAVLTEPTAKTKPVRTEKGAIIQSLITLPLAQLPQTIADWVRHQETKLEFEPLPTETPKLKTLQLSQIPEKDIQRFIKNLLEGANHYQTKGKEIIFRKDNKFIVFRFLGQGEDVNRLQYEYDWLNSLNILKAQGFLRGAYPIPIPLEGVPVVRVEENNLPPRLQNWFPSKSLVALTTLPGIDKESAPRYYVMTTLTFEGEDFVTSTTDLDAILRNIHELMTLARFGYVNPETVRFISRGKENGQDMPYLWMHEILRPSEQKAELQKFRDLERDIFAIRMQKSGPSHLGVLPLEALVHLDHPEATFPEIKDLEINKRSQLLLAHSMGNYLLAGVLREGQRRKALGQLDARLHKDMQGLAEAIKSIYVWGFKAFTGKESATEINQSIDWEKAAQELARFLTLKDKEVKHRRMPDELIKANYIYTAGMLEIFGHTADTQMLGSREYSQQTDTFTKGGIDLNPALLDLQIKQDANGIPLPLPQQPIESMSIEGFIPIIIQAIPINLPLLLGIAEPHLDKENLVDKSPKVPLENLRNFEASYIEFRSRQS